MTRLIIYFCRWLLGLVLIAAGLSKVAQPVELAQVIEGYRLVPAWLGVLVAVYLPWLELVTGLSLLLGVVYSSAQFMTGVLLVSFTIAVGSAWLRGLDITCGCFAESADLTLPWALGRNIILTAAFILLVLLEHKVPFHTLIRPSPTISKA